MTDEQFEKLMNKRPPNPLEGIPKWWGVAVAIGGMIFTYATLSAQVQQNTDAISAINETLEEVEDAIILLPEKINDSIFENNTETSRRLELYADKFIQIEGEIDSLDRKILIIENSLNEN